MFKNTAVLDDLTSAQGSLWIKDVSTKCDSLGHYMLVKSNFFGIVEGVAHHRGAEDILHGLPQVWFIAYQGQSCVNIVLSDLTGGEKKQVKKKLKEVDKNVSYFVMWDNIVFPKTDNCFLTRLLAVFTTLSSRVLAEILFKGIIVYLRWSSPFSRSFLPVTLRIKKNM